MKRGLRINDHQKDVLLSCIQGSIQKFNDVDPAQIICARIDRVSRGRAVEPSHLPLVTVQIAFSGVAVDSDAWTASTSTQCNGTWNSMRSRDL